MKATQGGVQNSYMGYYEFFRPTPGDKYRLVPYEVVFFQILASVHAPSPPPLPPPQKKPRHLSFALTLLEYRNLVF